MTATGCLAGGKGLPQSCMSVLSANVPDPLVPGLVQTWHTACIEIGMEINSFANYEQALRFRAHRNEVLSSNIANADTPGYKARDLDFGEALKRAGNGGVGLTQTSEMHQNAWRTADHGAQLKYRVPMQPSLDGNTVEADVEQTAFAENAVQYRAALAFLDGSIRSLKLAIKGGE